MDRFENRRRWPFLDRRRRPGSSPPSVQLGITLGVAALFLSAWILLVVPARRPAEPPASSFVSLDAEGEARERPRTFASPPAPEEAEESPVDGGCPEGCLSAKSGCEIKGNVSLRTGERIHHLPGQRYYEDTVISHENGERWFCTEDEAEANGWRRAKL